MAIGWSRREYPTAAPLSLGARANFESQATIFTHNESRRTSAGDALRMRWIGRRTIERARGGLEFGVGRVRDVTAVADARVLEARLLRGGVLARPLTSAARRRLAQVVSVEGAFALTRDRPLRAEWAAIEAVLRDDGALRDSPSGIGEALRVFEPWLGTDAARLPRSPLVRLRGPLVAVSVDGGRSWLNERETSFGGTRRFPFQRGFDWRRERRHDDMTVAGRAEFHHPVGPHLQADVAASIAAPIGPGRGGATYGSGASVGAVIADRWIVTAGVAHAREIVRTKQHVQRDRWTVEGFATFQLRLEDRLSLGATLSDTQEQWNVRDQILLYPSFAEPARFRRSLGVALGLTWRLAARLHAPDVLDAPLGRLR